MAEAGKYRRVVLDLLVEYFNDDERYFLLVGDMGFGAIDKLKATHPARVINCGIMEQGMTGIAAGMSMAGLVPIVYSIVNFLVFPMPCFTVKSEAWTWPSVQTAIF